MHCIFKMHNLYYIKNAIKPTGFIEQSCVETVMDGSMKLFRHTFATATNQSSSLKSFLL